MERKEAQQLQQDMMRLGEGYAALDAYSSGMSAQWGGGGSLLTGSRQNAILACLAAEIGDWFKYNEFAGRIENNATVRDFRTGRKVSSGKPIDIAADIDEVAIVIEMMVGYTPTNAAVETAINHLARAHSYNPVLDHFANLPEWDGCPRLYGLTDYFNASPTELNNQILALIPRAIYARAISADFVPFPYCPVLHSVKGGQGKTDAVKAFAFDSVEWYVEGVDFGGFETDKKLQENIAGTLVVEIGEFSEYSRREMGRLKSTLTKPSVKGRPAWGRSTANPIIRNIFVATTNSTAALTDISNRRFPVVSCDSERINVDRLRLAMPQIYAEVKANHVAGTIALPPELWDDANAESDKYRYRSDFEEWFSEYSYGLDLIVSRDMLNAYAALNPSARPPSPYDKAAVYEKLGFISRTERVGDDNKPRVVLRRIERGS